MINVPIRKIGKLTRSRGDAEKKAFILDSARIGRPSGIGVRLASVIVSRRLRGSA